MGDRMNTDLCQNLRERIEEMAPNGKPESATAFANALALAARLAEFGDTETRKSVLGYYKNLKEAGIDDSFDEILTRRCRRGLYALSEQLGEELALSLIDAQDFSLFYDRDADLLQPKTGDFFRTWFAETELVELDGEAAAFLRDWLETWPIPEEKRLIPLVAPMSEAEKTLLDRFRVPKREIVLELDAAGKTVAETPIGEIRLDGRKGSQSLTFQAVDADGRPFPIRRMRLGALPAFRNEETPELWSFPLQFLSPKMLTRTLAKPINIATPLDFNLVVASIRPCLNRYNKDQYKVRLCQESSSMAAAADRKSVPNQCRWDSPDGRFTAWGVYRKKRDGSELVEIHFLSIQGEEEIPVGSEWNGRRLRLCGLEGTVTEGGVAFEVAALRSALEKDEAEIRGLEVADAETSEWNIWPLREEV